MSSDVSGSDIKITPTRPCGARDGLTSATCSCSYGHTGRHWDAARSIGWNNNPETVPGGATREPMPIDLSQLSHVALRLMGETQHEGNLKHGVGNWQKGIPISNLVTHALAHIFSFINGDTSENHLGHALWNLEKTAHFIETRPDLIDIGPLRKAMNLDPAPPAVRTSVLHCKGCGMAKPDKIETGGCVRGKAHDFGDNQ